MMTELNCRPLREALIVHGAHEGDDEEQRAAKIEELRKVAEQLLETDGRTISVRLAMCNSFSRLEISIDFQCCQKKRGPPVIGPTAPILLERRGL